MGDKRIIFYAEVTYPGDDTRSWEQLKADTSVAVGVGLLDRAGGILRQITVTGAAQDPDPEPTGPEVPPVIPPGQDI